MAHIVRLLVVVGLAASAYAWEPFTNQRRSLQEQSCPLAKDYPQQTPTITQYPVLDLEWVGADDQTVYAITSDGTISKGGLWRSSDGGAKFDDLTPQLTGGVQHTLSILAIHAQKSNANNVIVLGGNATYWVSNDKGATMTRLDYPGGVKGVYIRDARFNPRKDNWMIVHVKRASCKTIDKAHLECPKDLMLNKNVFDAKSEWINMTERSNGALAGFVDFDWAANLCPSNNCANLQIPDERILATAYARAEDYDKPWDKDVSYLISDDFFATHSVTVRCGNQLEVVGRSVYLAVANSCPDSPDGGPLPSSKFSADSITLFTSEDGGNTFSRACLPAALQQDGYELVETHDGRGALVIVDFSVDTGMMMPLYAASVYSAGPHHALFSLSMTNVFQGVGTTETTDFTRLEGVSGTYFANQVVPYPSSDGSAGSTDAPSSGKPKDMGNMAYYDYYGSYYYDIEDLFGEPLIETRVTYSAGGRWQRIRAPTTTRFPECACKAADAAAAAAAGKPCYLHLNGMSATNRMHVPLPGIYSSPSAPGLVVATGNLAPLGLGLDQSSGRVCTWLSRDGGVNWIDVATEPHIYEFADWGGIVVMAKYPGMDRYMKDGLTDKVVFSMDYGECWQSVPLSVPLYVDNIRIEPDGQQPIVIVHGEAPRNASGGSPTDVQGVMYKLDLKSLLGANVPTCSADAFETWSPPTVNGSASRCVLGQQLQLVRRKQNSMCFQGSSYTRPAPVVAANCSCTKQLDTECDYGYIRAEDTCKPIDKKSMPQCPVVDRGTYTVSGSGLRWVHGDQCVNGSGIIPDTNGQGMPVPSGGKRTTTSSTGWVTVLVVVLVLGVVIGGGFAWYRFRATDEQQETVREVASNAAGAVASAWGLLVDKIRGIRFRSAGAHPHAGTGEEMGYFQPLGDPGYDVEGRGNIFTLK